MLSHLNAVGSPVRAPSLPQDISEPAGEFLDSEISSTVIDLDATLIESYSGSGDFKNLSVPADGEDKPSYDFDVNGASFVGSAGDAAAYFTGTGSQSFDLKSGSNTDFLKNLHKTTGGSDFWFAMTFHKTDTTWQGNTYLFNTFDGGVAGNGFGLRQVTNETVQIRQDKNPNVAIVSTPAFSPASGDHILIVSHSHSTNTTRYWANSRTKTEATHTFKTSIVDADQTAQIYPNITAEDRLYSFACGNSYIDDSDAAVIINHLNARHERTYA